MKFASLAGYLQRLEKTASRNQMTEILADLLSGAKLAEVDKICYLSLGQLAPLYEAVEFNLAEKLMVKALALAYRKNEEEVRKDYKRLGDLGSLAADLNPRKKMTSLSVEQVYQRLYGIATDSGEGSVERKVREMSRLLSDLDALSGRYITRIPLGKLRLGFSDKTVLDALSWMLGKDKSKREQIEAAYNVRADVGQIAKLIKEKGLGGLRNLKVQIGVPVMPALCQRLPTAEEMIKKMCRPEVEHVPTKPRIHDEIGTRSKRSAGCVAVEPKYDGTRLQVHLSKKRRWEQTADQLAFDFRPQGYVRTFTRGLENNTHMFPDLVQALFKEVKAREVILDGEVIGFDPKTGKFLPFQETIKRKRKYGIGEKAKEIPLKYFCFDILYKDGRDLLKKPFDERREILEKVLSPKNRMVVLSPQIVTDDPVRLRQYHNKQIEKGLEGVVVKKWQSTYDPGRRGFTWVKFKQEKGKKGGGLADTLDCLVMGYYRGRGKRADFGIGAFLVGIGKGENFLTVSKIGTGLSDEQWREMRQRCEKVKAKEKPKEYQVDKNLLPDSWCLPVIVVEIEADNITRSPNHTAEYALRFPRLVRFRDDKNPQEVTTLAETKKLYQLQK